MENILREILKFTESYESKDITKKILHLELPSDILILIEKYETAGGRRDRSLWKWCWYVRDSGIILSSVLPEYFNLVSKIRLALTIFITTIDDVADFYKDKKFLDELTKIPFQLANIDFNNMNGGQRRYTRFTIELWKEIYKLLHKLPRFKEFEEMLMYDLKHSYDSLYYTYLVNTNPYLISLEEVKNYESGNMISYVYTGVELMASPNFDKKEIGTLREIVNYSQQMVRMGNWLGTWKREIKERDFSSAVVAYGLHHNIISVDELLTSGNEDYLIKKLENSIIRDYLLNEWLINYRKIKNLAPMMNSVNINAYLEGHKNLLKLQLLCPF